MIPQMHIHLAESRYSEVQCLKELELEAYKPLLV